MWSALRSWPVEWRSIHCPPAGPPLTYVGFATRDRGETASGFLHDARHAVGVIGEQRDRLFVAAQGFCAAALCAQAPGFPEGDRPQGHRADVGCGRGFLGQLQLFVGLSEVFLCDEQAGERDVQLDATFVRRLVGLASGAGGGLEKPLLPGLVSERITWAPDYRHLGGYEGQVPLLRLNASHGCLYQCSFCGDAWSKQLTLVETDALKQEVDDLTSRFPDTRLFYIGDKTFGQSREAVANLLDVFRDRPGYRFIVQTHVMQVKDWIVDAMLELGVVAVELGFESADSQMLKRLNKLSRGLDDYTTKIHKLSDAGLKVVLNMMGGLDEETEAAHGQTVDWMRENSSALWLFNLYNFVPYPLTPDFPRLRERIFNWDFADWREDVPVVYRPQHLSPEASWDLFQEKIAPAPTRRSPRSPAARPG
ncbi:radical SAM protein [Streptomyces sp. WAC04770]|nr:radical SAM protein [Streptomyces sp. WAC04770]RST24379.1 radical SAM protein [Streptomyces sp. WAC04770]